ncbi:MAG: hypothetical protein AMXMBFR13_25590 [Phycisphaerae bacterium]
MTQAIHILTWIRLHDSSLETRAPDRDAARQTRISVIYASVYYRNGHTSSSDSLGMDIICVEERNAGFHAER